MLSPRIDNKTLMRVPSSSLSHDDTNNPAQVLPFHSHPVSFTGDNQSIFLVFHGERLRVPLGQTTGSASCKASVSVQMYGNQGRAACVALERRSGFLLGRLLRRGCFVQVSGRRRGGVSAAAAAAGRHLE